MKKSVANLFRAIDEAAIEGAGLATRIVLDAAGTNLIHAKLDRIEGAVQSIRELLDAEPERADDATESKAEDSG